MIEKVFGILQREASEIYAFYVLPLTSPKVTLWGNQKLPYNFSKYIMPYSPVEMNVFPKGFKIVRKIDVILLSIGIYVFG